MKVIPAVVKQLKQLQRISRKKFWGFKGIRTDDLRDTGAMLYWLSYEASPEAGQVRVQFTPVIWRELGIMYMWYKSYICMHCTALQYI